MTDTFYLTYDAENWLVEASTSSGGSGSSTATSDHTHSCTTTTGSASNLPPYLGRRTPQVFYKSQHTSTRAAKQPGNQAAPIELDNRRKENFGPV